MNKMFLLPLLAAVLLSCNSSTQQQPEPTQSEPAEKQTTNVADKSFDELFVKIDAKQITDNVFKAVGDDWTAITANNGHTYNTMTASFGGWGILFGKPATWCFLRANRYTLELMKKEQTYTMSYFDADYKDQLLLFGSKSGRDSDKMNETTLTAVKTPLGNTTYKQARLVIECKLVEITGVHENDFYTDDAKKFVKEGFDDAKDWHKLVFGEITNVWVRK